MNKHTNGLGMHHGASTKIFQFAKELRERETEAEQLLWKQLKLKKLNENKFRRQHPLAEYILDFYCHHCQLAIELDGGYHYTEEQKAYDERRTVHLNQLGIKEIRFKNEEVINNIETVLKEIQKHLQIEE